MCNYWNGEKYLMIMVLTGIRIFLKRICNTSYLMGVKKTQVNFAIQFFRNQVVFLFKRHLSFLFPSNHNTKT